MKLFAKTLLCAVVAFPAAAFAQGFTAQNP